MTRTASKPARKQRKGRSPYAFWAAAFIAPFVICYLMFNLFPVVYTFFVSLFDWSIGQEKVFIGFENYFNVIKDPNFLRSVTNTVYIMLISFPIAIFLGLVVAVFLSELTRGRLLFQTLTFLPYITTAVAVGLVFSFLFDWTTGIVNRLLELVGIDGINWLGDAKYAPLVVAFMIVWKYTGYYMVLYLAGITAIPTEMYEAARVDGAGKIATFFQITLPQLKNTTTFIVITGLIVGLQLFDEPNTLFSLAAHDAAVGGPERSALTIVWNFFDVSFQSSSRLGYGSAVATSLFALILAISLVGIHFPMKDD